MICKRKFAKILASASLPRSVTQLNGFFIGPCIILRPSFMYIQLVVFCIFTERNQPTRCNNFCLMLGPLFCSCALILNNYINSQSSAVGHLLWQHKTTTWRSVPGAMWWYLSELIKHTLAAGILCVLEYATITNPNMITSVMPRIFFCLFVF